MSKTRLPKWQEDWNKAVERQSLGRGGFCADCGEACEPFVSILPQELKDTACEYNGEHPDCGDHDMVYIETTPESFGSYEIWECSKCKRQESC